MNQYRVELWIESCGDVAEKHVFFQFQVNGVLDPVHLVMAAMFLSGCVYARETCIEVLVGGRWSVLGAGSVSVSGFDRLSFRAF